MELEAIIKRLNQEKLQRYRLVKQEILDIATPSTDPGNFTDLEEILERIEKDLNIALRV